MSEPGNGYEDRLGSMPMEYVGYFGDELRSRGLSTRAWLAGVGLTADDVAKSDALIGISECEALILDALRLAREPGLGLFVGRRLGVASHGIVGALAVNAKTIGDAMMATSQFSRLRTTLLEFRAVERGEHVDFQVKTTATLDPNVERVLVEAVLTSIQNVVREVTNRRPVVESVLFRFRRPEYAHVAESMFDGDVIFDAEVSGFRATLDALATPLELADPDAFEVAAHICEAQLAGVAAANGVAAQVRRLMLQPSGIFPSLEVTARQMHMNPRTLHRRLVSEGTSYREITDAVRHGLALEHLRSGRFTVKELANHLGYTDVANFRRAFKRWEGETPTSFRAQVRG